jgi:hypothetical protein
MAIRLSSVSSYFSGEEKLLERAENALKSGRLISFTYDSTHGVIKAAVQPSMKKGSYTVTVSRAVFNVRRVGFHTCRCGL